MENKLPFKGLVFIAVACMLAVAAFLVIVFSLPSFNGGFDKITIVEYADLKCPYSYEAESVMDELKIRYGDEIDIQWKNVPINDGSKLAAEGLECARSYGRFEDFKKAAFFAYFEENRDIGDINVLNELATELNLSNDWSRCMELHTKGHIVDNDYNDALKRNMRGTPTFIMGDNVIFGSKSIDEFIEVIENEKELEEEV